MGEVNVERLRELLANATQGTWRVSGEHDIFVFEDDYEGRVTTFIAEAGLTEKDDAALIAEAVNALPGLLDAIAALEARVRELEADSRRWSFYVFAMTDEVGVARAAIQRQSFPAHTKEAWDACIDKAMSEVVLPGAAND